MDKKISELSAVSTILATDLIPIVTDSDNKTVTAGTFALNLPNFGNKGLSKNLVGAPVGASIPLTQSLIKLSTVGAYTLAAGSDGQDITIVSSASVTVSVTGSGFATATMGNRSTLTLVFIVGSGWLIKSSFGTTFA